MIESAAQYHEVTSYRRNSLSGHSLDWENQPLPFKIYPAEPIPLPRHETLPEGNLSSLLTTPGTIEEKNSRVTLDDLSQVFRLAYSLTAKASYPGGDVYYRCVASAGALYPTEVYLAAGNIEGLGDGLYHFSVAQSGLVRLRSRYVQELLGKALIPPMKAMPPATFLLSSIFFRSAWKYRERAYRYHLLDTGHVLEHFILALAFFKLPANFTLDFCDDTVNHVLGFDTRKEVCLSLCRGAEELRSGEAGIGTIKELSEDYRYASTVAHREKEYPAVTEIHAAGTAVMGTQKPKVAMVRELGILPDSWRTIEEPDGWPEILSYAESIVSRRSRRNFIREKITRSQAQALLRSLCTSDYELGSGLAEYSRCVSIGMLVANVEGMQPGFYLLDHCEGAMGFAMPGQFVKEMAHSCLDQLWLGNAGIHFVFMTNLELLDQRYGARGYRYAMMSAGRLGERLYLVATSLALGCCGIGAFYDSEAQELLELNQCSKMLYLVAVGQVKQTVNSKR